jgi:hypothetical protein
MRIKSFLVLVSVTFDTVFRILNGTCKITNKIFFHKVYCREIRRAMTVRNYGRTGMETPDCRCPQEGNDAQDARYALAMAYVPWQFYRNTYEPDRALETGTIFPELDKPFMPGRRGRR